MIARRHFVGALAAAACGRMHAQPAVPRVWRVGVLRPAQDGIEISSLARLNEFLSFLEERGIVQE